MRGKCVAAVGAALLGLVLVSCGGSRLPETDALPEDTKENVARVLWQTKYDVSQISDEILAQLHGPKNTPRARGGRTRAFLDDLIANPDSCAPDYSDRHRALRAHADQLSAHQAYAMDLLLGPDSSRGYAEVPSTITFDFPQADAPQNQYQVGWHFFVGSAHAQDGEEYGVQLMFWHYALLPPAIAHAAGLSDQENQVLELHLAISRAGDRHYRSKPYVIAGTTGLIQFSEAPFDYRQGRNTMRSRHADRLFPIDLQAWGQDESEGEPVEIALGIGLEQTKGYVLNGDQGLAPACGGVGTLYYSVPNLRLTDGSWLEIDGQKIQLDHGKFWYDHQYGTGMLPDGNPRSELIRALSSVQELDEELVPGGWDWLMLQFDDDTEMGLSSLHSADNAAFYEQTGSNPPGPMTAPVVGVFIDELGQSHEVKGKMHVQRWIRSTVSYEPYEATHTWYPDWVKIELDEDAPTVHRVVHMEPIVPNGQQGWFAMGLQYSEGAVYLKNEQGQDVGRGFLESTGYANGTAQLLKLAGIPVTDHMLELMQRRKLDDAQAESCAAFLFEHHEELLQELDQCKGLF